MLVNGDYGWDHAALSQHHLDLLGAEHIFIPILSLQEPITMELDSIGSDETLTFQAPKKVRLSTTIITPEGPLLVLLSRLLLQSLGFNLDANLSRVRSQYNDFDF